MTGGGGQEPGLPHPPLHATVVAAYRPGFGWRGVLLRGPSGAGKSGLALRLIGGHGWRLVADDRALVWASGGRAFARAPATLAGLIEVRTVGVLPAPSLPWAELALVVDCPPDPAGLERIPAPDATLIAGVTLPRVALDARAADAPAKLACLQLRRGGGFDTGRDRRKEPELHGPGPGSPMRTA